MPVRKLIIEIETDSVIKRLVWLGGEVRLEGKNFIGTKCELTDVEIGYGSYLSEGCSLEKVSIGRFTSVGKNLHVSAGNHPIRTFVSSHPFFYSSHTNHGFSYTDKDLFSDEYKYAGTSDDWYVRIGNDVWIGDNVIILSGVTVHDGAVIGTGSVVTRDIDPYTVNVGIPARGIAKRFSDEQIRMLSESRWWERNPEWIQQHAQIFTDIDVFSALGGK